jgi:hypothetical protein
VLALAGKCEFRSFISIKTPSVLFQDHPDDENNKCREPNEETPIESTQEFLSYYNGIDDEIMSNFDYVYTSYFEQLEQQSKECDSLLNEVA